MSRFSRREFLAGAALLAAQTALPLRAGATARPGLIPLTATTRVIEVNGRAATVFGLADARQQFQGLTLAPGARFQVRLNNALDRPTLVHWHGQIPPHAQDGVPDLPLPAIAPGASRDYDFAPLPGTHWMHSHLPLQEMRQLAAPLIVLSPEDVAADRQDVVLFLQDFAFDTPEALLERLAQGDAHAGMNHGAPATAAPQGGHAGHGAMAGMQHGTNHHGAGMADMAGMDLNDIDFDAYLVNDRTLDDPEVVMVERGGRVRLRVINASAATSYWIDTGRLPGQLVAVDGHAVQPVAGQQFGLAMGQRLDIELQLPGDGAFPILALREGAVERTGLVLATPGAQVTRLRGESHHAAPAFDLDLAQERQLQAVQALPSRPAQNRQTLTLDGSMSPYRWAINERLWGEHEPVAVKHGERVELTLHNRSMMGHPMHLHGHVFQVVAIGGQRVTGALRDTVYVPPGAQVTVAFDAGEAARWMLHCHHLPHLVSGMMTELAVQA